MASIKYVIPEISALSLISSAIKKDDGYKFSFDTTDPPKEYLCTDTLQDDCPMFYQAMCILEGEHFHTSENPCKKLRDVFVYIDFSGVFDRKPIGRILEQQKIAEDMFKPEGIMLNFGGKDHRYIAFERSASMTRNNCLSFLREDVYTTLKERMMLGMSIGDCQLSKLYAYNALLFTSGTRFDDKDLLSDKRIIVIDNPETIIKNADIITVEDDGTDKPMRKYTRTEKKADVKITEFDGEGFLSKRLSYRFDETHHSYQIRMPYIKGVVHEVDFAAFFKELNVPYILDIFGQKHEPKDVDIILTKSMFKGFGWMKSNGLSWSEYLKRCKKYNHALYVSGTDKAEGQSVVELNYQFLNTLAIKNEDFRPADLPLGWNHTPERDSRSWITKTTETAYYNLITDSGNRRKYFTDNQNVYADIISKNGLFVDEPIFSKELADKAENILNKYAVGKLLVSGDNRYLSDDLMRLLGVIVENTMGKSAAYRPLEKEFLNDNYIYAPKATYEENDSYTLLRSPHIARNEEVIAKPLKNTGTIRQKYLSHLHYVVMVDSRSLIPERLGGADFDGDMIKTVADPLINSCVLSSSTELPLLKIPTAEPLISDANDWYARFLTVKSTFSSRVGQISNAALSRGIIAYDENLTSEEKDQYLSEVETLAILTGLEIDSSKSGIKPDLSEYIEQRKTKRSLFLKYKAIADSDENTRWFEPTKLSKINKYFNSIDWNNVSSNLEKLPYYAYMLDAETQKAFVKPVSDEQLFVFANEPNWKENLNVEILKRVKTLITDYETALRRVQYAKNINVDIKRKNDIYRILFARGQEKDYTIDELYSAFDSLLPHQIRKARLFLTENCWQFTPPEERINIIYSLFKSAGVYQHCDLFCDFRNGGYRLLGDIICDLDDMYRNMGIKKNIANQNGDSLQLKRMLLGAVLSKEQIIQNCKAIITPIDRREKDKMLNYTDVVKCSVALGKRQFALEVLPYTVLELALDRSEVFADITKPKRRFLK